MKKILTALILFTVLSCNYFENKKVDPKDIVKEEMEAIKWNDVDEYPSFEFCDTVEGKIGKRNCFENFLSRRVGEFLSKQQLIVSREINSEGKMVISINSEGKLSVDNVEIDRELNQELPEIDSLLTLSLDSLPKIYPAIKRGQQVKTKFVLPIKIVVE